MSVQKTTSPVDGRVYVERELAGAAQIDAALSRAVEAQREWRAVPLEQRAAVCLRFVDAMESNAAAIGEELAWQMGRPVRYGPNEIRRGFAERARYMTAVEPEALAKICMVGCQGEHRHDFRRLGNHKLSRPSPGFLSQENVAQRAITHPKRARPSDLFRIDIERISVKQMVIDKGGQEIMTCGNRMRVPSEMQIDIFHGPDLCPPATGPSALDAKDRSE